MRASSSLKVASGGQRISTGTVKVWLASRGETMMAKSVLSTSVQGSGDEGVMGRSNRPFLSERVVPSIVSEGDGATRPVWRSICTGLSVTG